MVKTISASEARTKFGEIIDDVNFHQVEYVILKHDKEVARLVPESRASKVTPDFMAHMAKFADRYHKDLSRLSEN